MQQSSTPLPPAQTDPKTWVGVELSKNQAAWLLHLTDAEVGELEAAASAFSAPNTNIATLRKEDFPLPLLGERVAEMRHELLHGRGFVLLRGLPVNHYSQRTASAIFFGLGTHLGHPRSQNAQGHVLGHVRDLGVSSNDPNVRIYQTSERQTFHTDSADVVGLLCLKAAKVGGVSMLVSASTIFNEMRQQRPDLLKLLLEPIATDRRGEVPEGMLPYFLIPVFNWYEGHLSVMYQRQYIDSAQRFDDAPRLTPHHVEALDLFDHLTNDPRLNLSMALEPGDMQFVYNHSLLHDRTGFEDWEADDQKRHLLRLWLSMPGDRPLPPIYATRYESIEIGNRGGIIVPGSQLCVPE